MFCVQFGFWWPLDRKLGGRPKVPIGVTARLGTIRSPLSGVRAAGEVKIEKVTQVRASSSAVRP